jgi:hypothetical protein
MNLILLYDPGDFIQQRILSEKMEFYIGLPREAASFLKKPIGSELDVVGFLAVRFWIG